MFGVAALFDRGSGAFGDSMHKTIFTNYKKIFARQKYFL
jgi:hypothetical protein